MLIGGKKGTDYAAVALLLVHFILTVGSIATISEKKKKKKKKSYDQMFRNISNNDGIYK